MILPDNTPYDAINTKFDLDYVNSNRFCKSFFTFKNKNCHNDARLPLKNKRWWQKNDHYKTESMISRLERTSVISPHRIPAKNQKICKRTRLKKANNLHTDSTHSTSVHRSKARSKFRLFSHGCDESWCRRTGSIRSRTPGTGVFTGVPILRINHVSVQYGWVGKTEFIPIAGCRHFSNYGSSSWKSCVACWKRNFPDTIQCCRCDV